MKLLQIFNKEQWTAFLVTVISFLAVGDVLWSGGSDASEVPTAEERGWRPAPARFADSVDPQFKRYCPRGALQRVFRAEATTKLPIPVIPPPEPREGTLSAPLFIPGPKLSAYNQIASIKVKYIPLVAGTVMQYYV